MVKKHDIYIYGMTVMSTVHLLAGDYPKADTYQEIKETYHILGGETGNSAILLSSLGYSVKIDGPYLGRKSKEGVTSYCNKYQIDCSNLTYDNSFDGVNDVVLIGGSTRTVFGWFGKYFSSDNARWTQPDYDSIDNAKVIGLDPYFPNSSEQVALYCAKVSKPYVCIDSPYESVLSKHCAAISISNEYIQTTYPDIDVYKLMELYTKNTNGLVVFTFGAKDVLYSRKNQPINKLPTCKVNVMSTLGAGDIFRAGLIHGVYLGLKDIDIVRFATAASGCVISRFPMADNPPTMDEILKLMNK